MTTKTIEIVKVPTRANFRTHDFAVLVDGQNIYQTGSRIEAEFIATTVRVSK